MKKEKRISDEFASSQMYILFKRVIVAIEKKTNKKFQSNPIKSTFSV